VTFMYAKLRQGVKGEAWNAKRGTSVEWETNETKISTWVKSTEREGSLSLYSIELDNLLHIAGKIKNSKESK